MDKTTLAKRLKDDILVFDGAMGTMVYSKGIYINQCFDELNLSNPSLVIDIHKAYRDAGVDVLETNTYGANRFKLQPHGLIEKLQSINYQGALLARKAAGPGMLVAGSIGPLGIKIEPWGKTSLEEAEEVFREQARALLDGGVDLFILETFSDINEIRQALKAVKSLSDIPVIAQMTIDDDGNSLYGTEPETFTSRLEEWGADVIGLNCSVGPKVMLDTIERMVKVTEKPLSAMPNAGHARIVDGRNIFLCSPEYMGEYAKRFIQTGVRILGGCCGTTPEHIRAMVATVRALRNFKSAGAGIGRHATVISGLGENGAKPEILKKIPVGEKSGLGARLAAGEFVASIEITPPKGWQTESKLKGAALMKKLGVDAVNIPDSPRAAAKMSCLALAVLIQQKIGLEAIMHYCCRDRNLLGMQSDILGAWSMGLKNILVITGDPPKIGPYPFATAVFDVDSIGLVNVVDYMNRGLDLGGNPFGEPTGFLIGVGANPGAIDLEEEVRRFAWKVEAGAEYAMTQPVFDPSLLRKFLKKIESFKIPVLAGVWPLVSLRNAEFMNNEVPGAHVPDSIMDRMKKCETAEQQRLEGVAIAQEAIQDIGDLVQGVQVSVPLGRYETTMEVLSTLPRFREKYALMRPSHLGPPRSFEVRTL